MSNSKSIELNSNNNKLESFNGKEYINDYRELLANIKNAQKIIMENETYEIPVLIKLATRNLTKSAISQSKSMIINLQKNFNDDGILEFIEKTISLVTAIETANLLYGDLIDINEVRKYLSNKTTEIVLIRVNNLLGQFKKTRYEEKYKISFLVENLKLCNKLFEYCWDIYPNNIQTLKYTISILKIFIKHRVKIGLDDYNIELLNILIQNNEKKIENISSKNEIKSPDEMNVKSRLDESVLVNEEVLTTDLIISSSGKSNSKSKIQFETDRFIKISNDVIDEITGNSNSNFINTAFQKYNSIIAAIETLNFFGGTVIDKGAVSKNISVMLTDIIYTNFKTINLSWDNIEYKTTEDYITYYKEIYNYKKLLFEAYEINKENIDALRKSIEIDIIIYKDYKKFNLSKSQSEVLKSKIEHFIPIIKKEFVDFKGLADEETPSKKKKGFWSKIFK